MAKQKISDIFDLEKDIQQLAKLNDELAKTLGTLSKFANATGPASPKMAQELNKANIELNESNKALKQLMVSQAKYENALRDAPGSLRAMRAEMENTRRKLDELNLTTKEGQKQADEYRKRIHDLKQSIKENADELSNQRANIGNYSSAMDKMKGALIAAGMGLLTFTGALKAAKFIIASTDTLSDKWDETLGALKESLGVLGRAMANLDFSNLGRKMREAAEAGADYAKAMDAVRDRTRALGVIDDEIKDKILDQEKIFRNRLKTDEERKKAGEEMKRLQKELTKAVVENTQAELDANLKLAKQQSGLSEEEIQRYVAQRDNTREQLLRGQSLIEQFNTYNKIQKSGVSVVDGWRRLMQMTNGTLSEQARIFRNSLNPEQLAALEVAEKYGNITEEVRDKIAQVMETRQMQKNEEKEAGIAMLRVESSIQKNITKTSEAIDDQTIKREKEAKAIQDVIDNNLRLIKIKEQEQRLSEEAGRILGLDQKPKAQTGESFDTDSLPFMKAIDAELEAMKEADKEKKAIEEEELRRKRKLYDDMAEAANKSLAVYATIVMGELNARKMQLDNEYAYLQEQLDKKLITETQYQQQKEKLDDRARKLQHEKAVKDRQIAIFEATINVAQGVTAALSGLPPMSYILAALTAALGAAQIAAITGAPLPKYEKGRKGGKAEWALVHPGELIEANGTMVATPGRESLAYLPAGASVYTKSESELLKSLAFSEFRTDKEGKPGYDLSKLAEQQSRENAMLIRAIERSNKQTEVNLKGMYDSQAFLAYENRNFRH